jgi:DNA repair photolyase
MKTFTNHEEEWGDFIDVKINSPEILEIELKKIKDDSKIFISSVTDCYQEIEKKYKLTRKILEKLEKHNFKVSLLTKSKLILRDVDILKKLDCEVGFSISTIDDNYRKAIEPNASSIEERIESLRFLKQNNISTYAFIAPIIPYITTFEDIFEKINDNADYIMGECININNENWERLLNSIKGIPSIQPQKLKSMINSKELWNKAEEKFISLCSANNIECRGFFKHI